MLADIHQDQSNRPEGKQIVHDEVPKDVRPFRTRQSMSLNHAPNLHISSIQLKRRKSQCDFRHTQTVRLYIIYKNVISPHSRKSAQGERSKIKLV